MKTITSSPSPHKTVRTTVLATASVVTILSIAERALGFLYRIVLSRLIGAEGLGLYQVALSLFSVFLTIGTGGIPITVSRLISKSKAENDPLGERSAVGAGVCLCLLLTLPVALVLGLFPQTVSFLFSDERGVSAFRILLIGLVFSSLYAVVRGSFWGNKQFLAPSVLELAEEAVMVIAGVLLLQNVSSVVDGANRASWAVVISYLFSFTASSVCFFLFGGKLAKPEKQLKPLFRAALPITSVRASGSLVNSAVAVLLPAMLVRAGATDAEALSLFGIVSGMAMPVLFIPSTIIGSLSLVLVPELSEDFYRKNTKRLYQNLARGLSVTVLISVFLIPFFYSLGGDLGNLAFSQPLVGDFITKGCIILLPMSLTMISTGMLNSMGFEKQTFIYYFVGAAVLLVCILILPSVCGAYAYVWGLGASYAVTAVLNLVLLGKKCPELYKSMWKGRGQGSVRPLLRATLAILPLALVGSLFAALFKRIFGQFLSAVFAAVVLALLTLATWILLGVLPVKSLFGKRKNGARKK
ncbi:MAG: oligosaccharide flippase family protein [Clostridia bacterium]|nr:oligosaccharide flippase family protein [Clostridia bacterium]